MLDAFAKAFSQLSDPRLRGVVVRSVLVALAVLLGLVAASWSLLGLVDTVDAAWLEWMIDVLGGFAAVVLAWLLFPPVVVMVSGLFLEAVCDAVEARHYPAAGPARRVPLVETLAGAAMLVLQALLINLLLLPVYLVTMFVPGLNLVLFYLVNGYLLGREFFEEVAHRHMARRDAALARRANRGPVWMAGAIIAFLTTVPVVNMLAPVVATAAMVHVFHSRIRPPAATTTPA